jgi:predicted nuclease of predicted toxin-antitoxin system
MRVLLDESMPRQFAASLTGHNVQTVVQCGWAGTKNGKLLTLAAANFDVLVTADRNIQYQQNLKTLPITVVILTTPDNLLPSFQQLAPQLLSRLPLIPPRTLVELQA